MAHKQGENKKKRGFISVVLRLSLLVASVYLVVAFVSGQLQVAEKQRQLDEVTAKVEQQAEKNEELQRLMKSGDDDAYVERMAREKLHYARPEEQVFVDITGE